MVDTCPGGPRDEKSRARCGFTRAGPIVKTTKGDVLAASVPCPDHVAHMQRNRQLSLVPHHQHFSLENVAFKLGDILFFVLSNEKILDRRVRFLTLTNSFKH